MARFQQKFRVNAALSALWDLHDDPNTLTALTPPPLRVKLLHMDDPIVAGSTLKFRMTFLTTPLGATWHAIYDEYEPYQPGNRTAGFVDRALSGPFHSWTHRHTFTDEGDGTSSVTDAAQFELLGGPLGAIVSWVIGWPAVAFLFIFRRFKTRQLLAANRR